MPAPAARVTQLAEVAVLARGPLEKLAIKPAAGVVAFRHVSAAGQLAPAAQKIGRRRKSPGAVAQQKQVLCAQTIRANRVTVEQIHLAISQQKIPQVQIRMPKLRERKLMHQLDHLLEQASVLRIALRTEIKLAEIL